MFGEKTIKKIASLLKLNEAEVLSAFKDSAEKDIEIPDNLVVMTSDEQSTRDSNLKKKYLEEGKDASIEMFIKENKKSLGLDFEGKDPAKFLEAYAAKIIADAKITPNEAVAEKEKTIETLKKNISDLQKDLSTKDSQIANIKIESEIMRSIPANLNGVEPEEVLSSMKLKGYEFTTDNGKVVAKKDGEILSDKQLNALPVADVIKGYATERKWLTDEDAGGTGAQGRGGSSSKSKGKGLTTPTTLTEAEAEWKKNGKNPGTSDFTRYIESLQKENPNFDLEIGEPK